MINLNDVLREAREKRASDIHFSVGTPPKFRIHGSLVESNFHTISPSDTLELLVGFMTHEQREYFEEFGQIELSVSVSDFGRLRVNAYKQKGTITIALRLVNKDIPDAEAFDIPESVLELCDQKKGLVIIAGPSGAGKSSLLAALTDRVNTNRNCNIITLEDPIEFIHENKKSTVNQREIGLDSKDYPTAMKSALRSDPDVLTLSRLRDSEVASLVLTAAETGRLVFVSMSANNTVEALGSFLEIFPMQERVMARYRLSDVLKAVVCRQLLHTTAGESVPAYELFFNKGVSKGLIREGDIMKITSFIAQNTQDGMLTMDQCLIAMCLSGAITASDAKSGAQNQEAVEKALQKQGLNA
ncbi:MAG: PilT/PilU family type 4a pilus ATPase [Lachnospiraceae bacterium]|nr:PilT/PilU family type 4a pilus ATPase [Lachnospiraceae bacterium]